MIWSHDCLKPINLHTGADKLPRVVFVILRYFTLNHITIINIRTVDPDSKPRDVVT